MARRLASVLLLALVFASGPACDKSSADAPADGSDTVDELTTSLLVALRQGQRDDVLALANAALANDLDERDVAVIARTFAWLGQHATPTRASEQPLSNGVERHYQLAFDRGEVELSVSVVDGKLEGFHFDEQVWPGLVDAALAAAAGSLNVVSFQFVDIKGKPLAQPNDPKSIHYDLALEGLAAQLREHQVSTAKRVFDAEGHQVYRQDEDDQARFSQAEPGASGGKLSGTVAVPGPGSYVLELEIQDTIGSTSLVHRVPFVID